MLARDHGDHKHEWDDELTPEGVPVSLAEMSGNEVAHLIEDIDGYLCELGMAQIRDGLHIARRDAGAARHAARADAAAERRRARACRPRSRRRSASISSVCWRRQARASIMASHRRRDRRVMCRTHARRDRAARERWRASCSSRWKTTDFRASGRSSRSSAPRARRVPTCRRSSRRRSSSRAGRLMPALERVTDEIDARARRARRALRAAGTGGRADARDGARAADGPELLCGRSARACRRRRRGASAQQLAREVLERHLAEEGRYPEMIGLGAWGTSQMRTQGDDIAEVLALLGVEPVWDPTVAARPGSRGDSARAARAAAHRRHAADQRLLPRRVSASDRAGRSRRRTGRRRWTSRSSRTFRASTISPRSRDRSERDRDRRACEARARYRIFGAKPGTYGAGIQAADRDAALAERSGFRDGVRRVGRLRLRARRPMASMRATVFAERLRAVEVAVHNQDNREHDIFDSDDYYQFHGGMIATRARADRASAEDLLRRQLPSRRRARARPARGGPARLPQPRRQSEVARRASAAMATRAASS